MKVQKCRYRPIGGPGIVCILIVLIFMSACQDSPTNPQDDNPYKQEPVEWPSLADSPWPMSCGNPQLTNQGQSAYIVCGDVKWAISLPEGTIAGIAVDGSDNIYFGSTLSEPYLYKINSSGEQVWNYVVKNRATPNAPLIGADNTIYFADFTSLYAIDGDKNTKWLFNTEENICTRIINTDLNGRIYLIAGNSLFCLDKTGKLVWKYSERELRGWYGVSISCDGATVYATGLEYGLYAIDTSGTLLWESCLTKKIIAAPAVDNYGNLYFPAADSVTSLLSVNENGNELWHSNILSTGSSEFFVTPVSISYDGTLLIAGPSNIQDSSSSYSATLYCFTLAGDLKWEKTISNDMFSAPILISKAGQIFVASTDINGSLYSFNKAGEYLWSVPIDGAVDGSMAFLSDGSLIVGTHGSGNKLYAIQ